MFFVFFFFGQMRNEVKMRTRCIIGIVLLIHVQCIILILATPSNIVYDYVKNNANKTFKSPNGELKFPYLIPSGPYNQLWDWDSLFMGVAMFEFGSAPYLSGAMENFLYHTNITNGEVQGCLLPSGGTGTIFHAKPVVIQGAWLAAQEIDHQHYHHHQQQNNNNNEKTMYFKRYAKQMAALLKYWTSNIRLDQATQLPKWYNQLESGQDNLP